MLIIINHYVLLQYFVKEFSVYRDSNKYGGLSYELLL